MSEAPDKLIIAIETGDVDCLAKLLVAGADPNATVISRYYTLEERLTPLLVAVRELDPPSDQQPGHPIDAVVLLLRYGADVNLWDEKHSLTPLLIAVMINHAEAVHILLAAGADPNVCGDEGDSPLRFCAQEGLLEMARLLLHCGAHKIIHEAGGMAGMNALGWAVTRLDIDMVRLLLSYGADPTVEDADRMTVFDHLRVRSPLEDPADQERLREIRQLLGDNPRTATHEK
jgi:ankyrin repeat protein